MSHFGLPKWHYSGLSPATQEYHSDGSTMVMPPLEGPNVLNLGSYRREQVSNLTRPEGRAYFDMGLRLMMSYQHELAARHFMACLNYSKDCALAHGLIALCHSPNYNFKGDAYYESAHHPEDNSNHDWLCVFPSQQVADRHSLRSIEIIEGLRKEHRKQQSSQSRGKKKGKKHSKQRPKSPPRTASPSALTTADTNDTEQAIKDGGEAPSTMISDVEVQWCLAIRTLTCNPGINPSLSDETVGRPFADAMRKAYQKYPDDPDICYSFGEALMVLNAWQLYEYPTGRPVSPDVEETRAVLEQALKRNPTHPGLCHMYVHLSEMSAHPELALKACDPLRTEVPHGGHLLHMPSHIDVLVGDYYRCVLYNEHAIAADLHAIEISPYTAGLTSFYFGYVVHNYHMAVYGAILGGMEQKAMKLAMELNGHIQESTFEEYPDLTAFLESYSAMEVHVMIRFGRWKEILDMPAPKSSTLMLYRAATLLFAKALAHANLGDIATAKKEAKAFDKLRKSHPDADCRILHNNSVANLLAAEAPMLYGEIAYFEGNHKQAFVHLRQAVKMQDNLNYDEPWGIMQPFRHALGGLLCEQGEVDEAEAVFREDLRYHPKNTWALVGLIKCLKSKTKDCCHSKKEEADKDAEMEIAELQEQLRIQQQGEWVDFQVTVPCACCQPPP